MLSISSLNLALVFRGNPKVKNQRKNDKSIKPENSRFVVTLDACYLIPKPCLGFLWESQSEKPKVINKSRTSENSVFIVIIACNEQIRNKSENMKT